MGNNSSAGSRGGGNNIVRHAEEAVLDWDPADDPIYGPGPREYLTVFVRGIPYDFSDAYLLQCLFDRQFGPVISASIPHFRGEHGHRGYGFVQFQMLGGYRAALAAGVYHLVQGTPYFHVVHPLEIQPLRGA